MSPPDAEHCRCRCSLLNTDNGMRTTFSYRLRRHSVRTQKSLKRRVCCVPKSLRTRLFTAARCRGCLK
eukprot:6190574-Pleurochrysis_carterae.AAC.7